MRNNALIRSKVAQDMALNMTELSHASGYRRQVLAGMNLPWQAGKLSLADFRRILRRRQDLHEKNLTSTASAKLPPGEIAADRPPLRLVDKFDAPSPRRVKPAASHQPRESRLRGSAK
jgi:hypothetical protein